jgi:hypothetical protein
MKILGSVLFWLNHCHLQLMIIALVRVRYVPYIFVRAGAYFTFTAVHLWYLFDNLMLSYSVYTVLPREGNRVPILLIFATCRVNILKRIIGTVSCAAKYFLHSLPVRSLSC